MSDETRVTTITTNDVNTIVGMAEWRQQSGGFRFGDIACLKCACPVLYLWIDIERACLDNMCPRCGFQGVPIAIAEHGTVVP